jgi:hypothetical protein
MHLRLRRAAFWALGIAGLVVALPQSSHGEEEWPGLPDGDGSYASVYGGAAQGGMAYAKRAKQWARSPDGMVTYSAGSVFGREDGDCRSRCVRHFSANGRAFIVSPEGAPAPYGYLAPMTVRSVGFGLMPVEATVQISQRRKDGYPVPFEASLPGEELYDAARGGVVSIVGNPTEVRDNAVNVQVLKVLVDGVDLALTGDCRTVTPAPMKMTSLRYVIPLEGKDKNTAVREWFSSADPGSYFHPDWGGTLTGTITIPPFTGCTTASGDDLSNLLTLSASGPDNPVSARMGGICAINFEGGQRPLRPGENTPRAASAATAGQSANKCDYGTKKFEYPARGAD